MIEAKMLESLCCPVGKAPMEYKNDRLVCTSCGLSFNIIDGIPDLLVDDATFPAGINSISELKCNQSR